MGSTIMGEPFLKLEISTVSSFFFAKTKRGIFTGLHVILFVEDIDHRLIHAVNAIHKFGKRSQLKGEKGMEKSKVYFTDFRTVIGVSLTEKLQKLIKRAGIESMDMDGKFVAIKMHFGELGNLAFLRPNYAKVVADVVKDCGGL